MDEASLRKLKVTELKAGGKYISLLAGTPKLTEDAELTKLGLSTVGKKEELVARILEAQQAQPAVGVPTSPKSPVKSPVASPPPGSPKKTVVSPTIVTKTVPEEEGALPSPSPATTATANATSAIASPATLSAEEARRRERALRFGIPLKTATEPAKVTSPKTPTGAPKSPVKASPVSQTKLDPEALRKRQERFGVVNPLVPKIIQMSEEEQRKQKRAERFGAGSEEESVKKPKVEA